MECKPTLNDVYANGKIIGSYQSRRNSSQFTMWQLNWQGVQYAVLINDNSNEIMIIYNLTMNNVSYMSPNYQLGLSDLWVK